MPKNWLVDVTLGGEWGLSPEFKLGFAPGERHMVVVGLATDVLGYAIVTLKPTATKGYLGYRYAFSGISRPSWYVQAEFAMGGFGKYSIVQGKPRGLVFGPRVSAGHQWVWQNGFALGLSAGAAFNFKDKFVFRFEPGNLVLDVLGVVPMGGISLGYAW